VATSTYVPESPASGQVLDRAKTISTSVSTGTTGVSAGSLSLEYDLLGHLTRVSRTAGTNERLYYAPGGELLYRQVDDKFVFYVGEYATVTASSTVTGCSTSCGTKPCACTPSAGSVEVDAHVVFAGTRIASAKPSRTLYYYRTRLGSVIATSLGGGAMGAMYRHDPYGKLELATGETSATSSELGYTNALRLSGGLLYLKNRVYDTEARVFVQPDTVDRLRYAYVQGDPVNFSDPSGLEPMDSGSPQPSPSGNQAVGASSGAAPTNSTQAGAADTPPGSGPSVAEAASKPDAIGLHVELDVDRGVEAPPESNPALRPADAWARSRIPAARIEQGVRTRPSGARLAGKNPRRNGSGTGLALQGEPHRPGENAPTD
jgi:RHS repeat-associated protein